MLGISAGDYDFKSWNSSNIFFDTREVHRILTTDELGEQLDVEISGVSSYSAVLHAEGMQLPEGMLACAAAGCGCGKLTMFLIIVLLV